MLKNAWAQPYLVVLDQLDVVFKKGLSSDEVSKRQQKYGLNQLRKHKKKSLWQILLNQLKSIIVVLLAVATFVSFIYGEVLEGWAVLVVIIINAAIGFFTELQAVRSMEALFKLGKVKTRVRRNGKISEIDAEELVPGDIVILEGGDVITADLRLIEGSKIQANESTLTGESMPVEKSIEPVEKDAVVADRSCMLHKGTVVTRGAGAGVVLATGTNTELGQISSLVQEAEEEHTPLEERLDVLGYRLIGLTLLIVLFVTLAGIYRGKDIFLMIETGIALAVASIPEGLPIVATIALAKGVQLMAEKNALVNRLSSVETLGTTGIIFTDKTGTLTENRMTVTHYLLPGHEVSVKTNGQVTFGEGSTRVLDPATHTTLKNALETGVLCNNASLDESEAGMGTGDPLEVALLASAQTTGGQFKNLRERYPELREEAFDPEVKMMATWNKLEEGTCRISVKGAPGEVLNSCKSELVDGEQKPLTDTRKRQWIKLNDEFAANGHRLIALACRETESTEGNPYQDLIFLGLVSLLDPPRKDVKDAITKCKEAGIRVIMVTGDQKETARFIAASVGLVEDKNAPVIHGKDLLPAEEFQQSSDKSSHILDSNIFARISPKQKLDLIELYQKRGYVVAMTGDGVNDAPALKKADIGIAMGQRGTQVAKEASDMVLTDDAFSTIVLAIKQGRVIFGNIQRFIYYLLSCNVSEILIVGLATLLGAPLPLLPLQILFLNLVTDIFPALALGMGKAEEGVMGQPPRKAGEPILDSKHWIGIGGYGLVITGVVIGALYIGLHQLELDQPGAVTISFLTLAFAQLWHVFNMRSPASGVFNNTITRNKWVWAALVLCLIITLVAVYIPSVAAVLKVTVPSFNGWMVILGMSLIPLVLGQLQKSIFQGRV